MACGCGRSGNSGNSRGRGQVIRPTVAVRAAQGGLTAGQTPTQMRMQAMNAPSQARSTSGMDAEKRKAQALRRQAIKKALGR